MKTIIIYLSLIAIAVGLSLGFTYFIDKSNEVGTGEEAFGATITTILSTDQISDSRTVINDNFAALNNAIHWTAGTDYLSASSSPTFGIILGDTSSSTIGSLKVIGDLSVTGNVTSTNATSSWLYISNSLTIGAYTLPNTDGTANYVLKTDGSGALTWQADEDSGIAKGAAWEYDTGADALITTSTKGIYLTASSSINTDFRIDGSATTTGSFYIGGDLFVLGDFRLTSYHTTNTISSVLGETETTMMSTVIKGGDMGVDGFLRATIHGRGSGSADIIWFAVRFGGETVATSTDILGTTGDFKATVDIYNRGVDNSQWSTFELIIGEQTGGVSETQASSTALTIDTSVDQTFLIVGDNNTAANTDIHIEAVDIQLYK